MHSASPAFPDVGVIAVVPNRWTDPWMPRHQLLSRSQKDRRVRAYLLGAALVLTLIVGFSRVYLGVHWPTDVVAGWAVVISGHSPS